MSATNEHITAIYRYLDRIGSKERRRLVLRGVAWTAVLVSAWLIFSAVAFSFGVTRGSVGLVLAGLAVPLAVLLVMQVLVPRWVGSRSRRVQALRLEARLPGLRSRLITVIDRAPALTEEDPGFSRELFDRAARHAHAATELLTPADVLGRRAMARALGAFVVAMVGMVVTDLVLPVGPTDAVSVLLGQSASAIRLADAVADAEGDAAVVGDITLRYVYPDYTGLEPKTVPNSDGTIHAPPGTVVQVTARTAEPVDAAAVQVNQDSPLDAVVTAGRDLTAEITVGFDGQWRILLFQGDQVTASSDFRMLAEADAPPVVVTTQTGQHAVPVDRPIGLGWSVTDDYGIARIALRVQDGDELVEHVRREPIDAVLELNGVERTSPRDLGLSPGDRVVLHIVAMDNDKSNGGNIAQSEPLELTILGAKGYARQLTRYHRRLLDDLLDALGDFLEETVPPANDNRGMLAWASEARGRLEPISTLYTEQWGDEGSDAIDAVVIKRVMETSSRLFRFTVVTFDVGAGVAGRRPVREDIENFVNMHAEAIDALEQAAWLVDSMLRKVAFREVVQRASQLAGEAEELAQFAADTPEADALLARLDQLERLMEQLTQAAAKLAEGQLREFVNDRMGEARSQMDAIRQAIAEGRLDEAQEMIGALSEQMQQFAEGLSEQMGRQGEGDDELARRYEQLVEDLDALEKDQASLADELAKAREELGDALDERMSIWEQLDTLSAQAVTEAETVISAVGDGKGWRAHSIDRAERLGQVTRGLHNAIRGRNTSVALERVRDGQRYAMMTERVLGMEATRARGPSEPKPDSIDGARTATRQLSRILEDMRLLLEQMQHNPAQTNPALEQAARSLSQQQGELRRRGQELEQEVQTVEQAIPTGNGEAKRSMEGAGQAMDRASDALGQGDAMSGEGNQRDAARQVGSARDHLQREMGEYQQMQQMQQRMSGEQGEGGNNDGDDQPSDPMTQPEIPAPELFRTPEEYRRSVLEGMPADVPEEFKALKKRFYEDLVRQ